jgi:hypothetical protein
LSFVLWPEQGIWPRTVAAREAGTYQFEGGRHKTTELLLWFGESGGGPEKRQQSLDAPLMARAATDWHCEAGAVWPLAPARMTADDKDQAEAMARYDRLQLAKVDADAGDPAGQSPSGWEDEWGKVSVLSFWERAPAVCYGWANYGDLVWPFGYASLHYDWPYASLMQYLRLGDSRFLDMGLPMAMHRYDIDQYHVLDTAPYLGGFQRYEKGEHGNLERQGKYNQQWEINPAPSHTWNRGLLLHWALTGDPRSLEAAKENGQAYYNMFYGQHKLGSRDKLPWNEFRSPGWAIENWLALYEYTGEQKYLDWANETFTKTLLAMEKDHGSKGHIVEGGKQGIQFLSYCIEPCCRLHYLTGRQDVAGFLKRVLDWERTTSLHGGTESGGKYTQVNFVEDWPLEEDGDLMGRSTAYNLLMADGYAYLYFLYGESRDAEVARKLFRDFMFYYGSRLECDPAERTPLGYHYLGRVMRAPCPKLHAFTGRYAQLFLLTERQAGNLREERGTGNAVAVQSD